MMMRRMKLRVNRSQLLSLSKEETSGSFQKEGTLQVGRQEAGMSSSILLYHNLYQADGNIFIFFICSLFYLFNFTFTAVFCSPLSLSSLLFSSPLFVLIFMLLVIFCSILFSFIFCLSSSFSYFFSLIIVFIFLLVLFFDLQFCFLYPALSCFCRFLLLCFVSLFSSALQSSSSVSISCLSHSNFTSWNL